MLHSYRGMTLFRQKKVGIALPFHTYNGHAVSRRGVTIWKQFERGAQTRRKDYSGRG